MLLLVLGWFSFSFSFLLEQKNGSDCLDDAGEEKKKKTKKKAEVEEEEEEEEETSNTAKTI